MRRSFRERAIVADGKSIFPGVSVIGANNPGPPATWQRGATGFRAARTPRFGEEVRVSRESDYQAVAGGDRRGDLAD